MTDAPVDLVVPGDPVPLERAGHGKSGGKYLPAKSKEYRERVQVAWMVEGRPRFPDEAWLSLSARFMYERPKSHVGKDGRLLADAPSFPPMGDTSNLVKAVEDALQDQRDGSQLLFKDDRRIVRFRDVEQVYADRGEEPRTEIEIRVIVGL